MRQKMLAIAKRIRVVADEDTVRIMGPEEVLKAIADCIDEELKGGEFTRCTHPVHSNPGLVAPCPECGEDPYANDSRSEA